jgi:molybdate transport system ATP-binding protein
MADHAVTLEARIGVDLDEFALDVELAVPSGCTVAVVGPNGSGKTTLLRALAGLTPLTTGRIVVDDQVLDDASNGAYVPPERRPVAMVFHDHVLFPHLTVVDNVAFGVRGRSRTDARLHAIEWLDRVGLADRAHSRPRELSAGQSQRVALIRALATDPRLLLLDEPLAALDATTRIEMRRELRRHLATFEGVRIVVTHDPVDAAVLGDEIVVLDNGRVAQAGTPHDVTVRPRSTWVADLVGTNLFRGRASSGRLQLDEGGVLATATSIDGDAFAVVHPRAVALMRTRPDGTPRNVWEARVAAVERIGDRMRIELNGPPDIVAEITTSAANELALHEGASLWVTVKATEVDAYPA